MTIGAEKRNTVTRKTRRRGRKVICKIEKRSMMKIEDDKEVEDYGGSGKSRGSDCGRHCRSARESGED